MQDTFVWNFDLHTSPKISILLFKHNCQISVSHINTFESETFSYITETHTVKYKIIMSTPCKNFNFQRRKIHVFLTQHKSLTKKTNDVTHKHLPQASSKDLKDFWIYWDMAVTFRTLRLEEFSYLSSLCEEVWYQDS